MRPALLFVALLGACYQPDVEDCVVACTGGGACAAGQVCGSDGWCADPSVAGACEVPASLHIVISGKGQIRVAPLDVTCNGDDGTADCRYDTTTGAILQLTPRAAPHQRFAGWTAGGCTDEPCDLSIATTTAEIGARFESDDQD